MSSWQRREKDKGRRSGQDLLCLLSFFLRLPRWILSTLLITTFPGKGKSFLVLPYTLPHSCLQHFNSLSWRCAFESRLVKTAFPFFLPSHCVLVSPGASCFAANFIQRTNLKKKVHTHTHSLHKWWIVLYICSIEENEMGKGAVTVVLSPASAGCFVKGEGGVSLAQMVHSRTW